MGNLSSKTECDLNRDRRVDGPICHHAFSCLIISHRRIVPLIYRLSVQFSRSVVSDSLRPNDCSMPGLPVYYQLPEFTQTHIHRVGAPLKIVVEYCRVCLSGFPSVNCMLWSPYIVRDMVSR